VLTLALRTLPSRLPGFVGAFVALTIAVAIVTAAGILVESGARAKVPVERYAAAPLIVAADQTIAVNVDGEVESELAPEQVRLPAALAGRLAAVEGVGSVIPDRSIPATVATAGGRVLSAPDGEAVLAHGWSSGELTPYRLTVGRPPRAAPEVVLDATFAGQGGVTVGDEVRITSTRGAETYAVVGLARPPRGGGWQGTAFVSDAMARSLSVDAARVDSLGVLVDRGSDPGRVAKQIERALGGRAHVHTGDDRGKVESPEARRSNEDLVAVGGTFGTFAVILAIFVVAATLGLSVLQRGRELALLRTVGAKPRQIRRLLVGETLIVALVAGLAGVAPGVLLASFLFRALRRQGIGAESATLVVGPLPPAIAVAVGVVTAILAAWLGGRRAARIRPTAALAEAALEPKRLGWLRLLLGVGFLAGGLFLSATALSLQGESAALASFGVVMILMVAVGLLGPLLAQIGAAIFAPGIAALFRTSGFLAMANVRSRARRFASASTPIALGVAVSLVLVGTVTVQANATENQSRERMLADRVLAAADGIPADLVDEVSGLQGVAAATGLLPTEVGAINRGFEGPMFESVPAVGVSPHGVDETLELDVREGSVDALPADGVAVSVDRARTLDVGVGDSVSLSLGDGHRVMLRVAATYASSLGLGEFVLPRAVVAGHVTNPMDAQMLVTYAEGADSAGLDAKLASLAERTPGLEVLDRAGVRAAEDEEADRNAWVTYLLTGVLIAFIAIAAANSLVMAVGERSRELAQLRLVGATTRQVVRMVRWEALAVIGFGVVIGAAVAAATLVPFSLAIAHSAVPYLPWQVVTGVLSGALLLGLGASELPVRNALRRDAVEVIGAQE
jgi:putative ABC transport system permease protein